MCLFLGIAVNEGFLFQVISIRATTRGQHSPCFQLFYPSVPCLVDQVTVLTNLLFKQRQLINVVIFSLVKAIYDRVK